MLIAKTPSVLNVLLHSPSTAMFKLLSPTYIYDFYPSLTTRRVALTISKYVRNSPAVVYCFGMRSYPVNSPLYRDCLRACPVKVRSTRDLRDVAKLHWNPKERCKFIDLQGDGLASEELLWRLSDHCYNHACENGGRPKSLYDEILHSPF
jgi:hypothetical protein